MKTKGLILVMLFLAVVTVKGQITLSLTIPSPIPNYDGTYDDFGQGQFYYPNGGEIRYANDRSSATDVAKFYTMNTYPRRFIMSNNNIALVHYKFNTTTSKVDSLQRIDYEWVHSNPSAFLARVDTQKTARLHYFTKFFAASGRSNVQGAASIACQSIYHNIDLVYTSNNVGSVMYFIVYPGGNYKDIQLHINGSKSNAIVSNNLSIQSRWDATTLLKPNMYQYSISGGVITPINVLNASYVSLGGSAYQLNTTSSYNSSLPLIIQLKQGNAQIANAVGLQWSTYFGGSAFDFLTKTHCDAADNLYVAGYSDSPNFPVNTGATGNVYNSGDGVIAQFSPTGVLNWSTFVGGGSEDQIRDFDFDASGNIYCVGITGSTDLVTQTKTGATNDATFGGPVWDGFIWEFTFLPATNVIQNTWLSYYGGNGDEELNTCKFDGSGNLFVAGNGVSTDLTPAGPSGSYQQNFNAAQINALYPVSTDGMIAKFNSSGLQQWFTFFGTDALSTNAHNNAGDYFYGMTITGTDLYVCGKSGGTNLPNSLNTKVNAGNFDGILVHFTTGGVLNANSSKYTNGNISNYAVKTLWGDVYTVGQTVGALSTVNSGIYYFNGTSSGTSDACFSVHSANLATTRHNTYLGGDSDDAAYDIQFTTNNLFVIAGGTKSSNFPVTTLGSMYSSSGNPIAGSPTFWGPDNFIAAFKKNSTSITWSTYLGSTFNESLSYPVYFNSASYIGNTTIALNSQNYIHVLGYTPSYNTFPLDQWLGVPTYYQPTLSNGDDGTITRFDPVSLNAIVGIKDFENTEFVFGLYPNPTTSKISITNTEISTSDLRYAIYDLSGKKLTLGNLKAGDVKDIDVSFLAPGVYIINVSNGVKTFSNKFVKTDN